MQYEFVKTEQQFDSLCDQLRDMEWIGFDTEFVSEFTYRPDLCLVQVASPAGLAIIDPREVHDVTPFWELLVEGDHLTIVHAGREEFRFCRAAVDTAPKRWFDVQIAAGMIGLEYPASYGKLLKRLLNVNLPKGETRSDWRRRPLTEGQLDYALEDVIHLRPLHDKLLARLEELGRADWLKSEVKSWQQGVIQSDSKDRWRRVSGVTKLNKRGMQAAYEIWQWRESEASRRDIPARRVLRDDLLVELAKRGKADVKQIRNLRGMQRRDLERYYVDIGDAIRRAADSPPDISNHKRKPDYPSQVNVLGQFLGTALASICRSKSIAHSLVGTVQDVRDLIAHRLGFAPQGEMPALSQGWRATIVGDQIDELLQGKASMRIADPHSEAPLSFDPYER